VALWLGTAVTILNKTLNQKFFHWIFAVVLFKVAISTVFIYGTEEQDNLNYDVVQERSGIVETFTKIPVVSLRIWGWPRRTMAWALVENHKFEAGESTCRLIVPAEPSFVFMWRTPTATWLQQEHVSTPYDV
jgi:hypothetical protein